MLAALTEMNGQRMGVELSDVTHIAVNQARRA